MTTIATIKVLPIGLLLLTAGLSAAGDLPDTLAKVKPSIVAVGTFQRARNPPAVFRGTGFVVGTGTLVITNAHVLPEKLDDSHREQLAVFLPTADDQGSIRAAEVVEQDGIHDIALLRIAGPALPALKFGDSERVREGETYAFIGYPIGMVLGLHPATHRGIIAAVTPIAIPATHSGALSDRLVNRLQAPYDVFQLDATAYPGNSGSPLFNPQSGEVIGVINKVFVQDTKETLLQKPSGISYAIPARFAAAILTRHSGK